MSPAKGIHEPSNFCPGARLQYRANLGHTGSENMLPEEAQVIRLDGEGERGEGAEPAGDRRGKVSFSGRAVPRALLMAGDGDSSERPPLSSKSSNLLTSVLAMDTGREHHGLRS